MSIFKKHIRKNPIASTNCEAEISSVTAEDTSANLDADTSTDVGADITTEKPIVDDYNIVSELKDILEKRWKEQEKCEKIPYEEMFQEIVDEAVYKIIEKWKTRAELNDEYKEKAGEEIELSTSSIFFVSDETRGLYSNDCNLETYPKTGRACLFNTLILPTADEENRFIDSVMKKLPEGTVCEINKMKWDKFRSGNFYSFKIKIVPDKK